MLANKYKLIAKLSQGSFGQVYKAENMRTGDLVAVKIEPKTGETKVFEVGSQDLPIFGKTRRISTTEMVWFN
jgi:serine/threonine protein kinase